MANPARSSVSQKSIGSQSSDARLRRENGNYLACSHEGNPKLPPNVATYLDAQRNDGVQHHAAIGGDNSAARRHWIRFRSSPGYVVVVTGLTTGPAPPSLPF